MELLQNYLCISLSVTANLLRIFYIIFFLFKLNRFYNSPHTDFNRDSSSFNIVIGSECICGDCIHQVSDKPTMECASLVQVLRSNFKLSCHSSIFTANDFQLEYGKKNILMK